MRNSLLLKLMGAFLLVTLIGTLVMSLLTSQATQSAFNLYTTRSGQVWAQRLTPTLAAYYSEKNNWQDVSSYLESDLSQQIQPGGMGPGGGRGFGQGRQNAGGGMFAFMDPRLILADANGQVVDDSKDVLPQGHVLTASELKNGAEILVGSTLVGTIIVTPSDFTAPGTPSGEFFASVNRAILNAALISALIALGLGGILFLQITSPLRQLKKAAAAIASGDLTQRVSIHLRDEFGELGNTFNQMAGNLADAETQRRHLVADVAHELRTPLAAIQGTLEGMQDGVLPLAEEQVSALYAETMLLARLVGDLKLLSLAEAGQLKLELREADLGDLIRKIAERDQPLADPKGIRLEAQIQGDLPTSRIDSDRITQVLNNLIGNAIQYTSERGAITIQAAVAPAGDCLLVSVTDTGPGIDPADLPFIFDRFYRADKSRGRASGGSGLGLAIVKQLVEAHGGSVRAESPIFQDRNQDGFGTKIFFTLPAKLSRP